MVKTRMHEARLKRDPNRQICSRGKPHLVARVEGGEGVAEGAGGCGLCELRVHVLSSGGGAVPRAEERLHHHQGVCVRGGPAGRLKKSSNTSQHTCNNKSKRMSPMHKDGGQECRERFKLPRQQRRREQAALSRHGSGSQSQ